LWIPKSGTENSTVIASPAVKIVQDKNLIRNIIETKYEADETVSTDRAKQWGYRAASAVEEKANGRNFNYAIDARFDFVALCRALNKDGLTYDGEAIRDSEPALKGVVDYMINLRSFVGADKEDHRRRQWIQNNWVKRRAEAEEMVRGQIDKMPNPVLEGFYDEAVYSAWSRELYWQDVEKSRKDRIKAQGNLEPKYELIPIEVYENSPENFL